MNWVIILHISDNSSIIWWENNKMPTRPPWIMLAENLFYNFGFINFNFIEHYSFDFNMIHFCWCLWLLVNRMYTIYIYNLCYTFKYISKWIFIYYRRVKWKFKKKLYRLCCHHGNQVCQGMVKCVSLSY